MADSAPLRRTIRRCTAVLVVALGVAAGSVVAGNALAAALLALPAALFLLGSLVYTPEWAVDGEGATE